MSVDLNEGCSSDPRWVSVHTRPIRAIATNRMAPSHVLSIGEEGMLCLTDMQTAATTSHGDIISMYEFLARSPSKKQHTYTHKMTHTSINAHF